MLSEAERASIQVQAAQLREWARSLRRDARETRERAAAVRAQAAGAAIPSEADALLQALETVIRNLRQSKCGSEARLVLPDQMGDLVTRYQLAELGVSADDVAEAWREFGLDAPLNSVTSAES